MEYIYIYGYLNNCKYFNNLNENGNMTRTGTMTGICTSSYPIEKVGDSPSKRGRDRAIPMGTSLFAITNNEWNKMFFKQ